jgi:hypothetical protein
MRRIGNQIYVLDTKDPVEPLVKNVTGQLLDAVQKAGNNFAFLNIGLIYKDGNHHRLSLLHPQANMLEVIGFLSQSHHRFVELEAAMEGEREAKEKFLANILDTIPEDMEKAH